MSDVIVTIQEDFTLPSKGMIYDKPIDPKIKLRSMTAQDEMLRRTPSEDEFRVKADVVERCIEGEKPAISVYDMYIGDYYYLLNSLRLVTFGSKLSYTARCLVCGDIFDTVLNIDDIPVNQWKDEISNLFTVKLPSGKEIGLNYQTPRMLDDIARRVRQLKKQNSELPEDAEEENQKIIFSIKTIDGRRPNPAEVEMLVKKMNMKDYNYLSQKIDLLNESIGPQKVIQLECTHCHNQTLALFRYSSQFFRPAVD